MDGKDIVALLDVLDGPARYDIGALLGRSSRPMVVDRPKYGAGPSCGFDRPKGQDAVALSLGTS